LGLFGGRSSDVESNIDAFIAQKIVLPQVFLKPTENEEHFRIYGHALYAANRLALLKQGVENGEPFWQGKVFLKCREAIDDKPITTKVFDVVSEGMVIGEISELDSKARSIFDFELDSKYVARAVIRADLIGNLVHLFVDPKNRIA
jgi:hypothetical protein